MKIKRLLCWLLVIAMCFSLAACQNNSSSDTNPQKEETTTKATVTEASTPLLYKVTDENGNVIWLFGSIHAGRDDFYPLPSYVLNAFDSADSLAVEADIIAFEKDVKAQGKVLSHLMYRDGTTIKDHIPQELYAEGVEILKALNSYNPAMDYYFPSLWSSMIESLLMEKLNFNIDLGIDRHLIERAYNSNKEVLEIESAEFQYKMLASFDDDLQALLLEASIETYKDQKTAKNDLNEIMDLWASGDEKAFAEYFATTETSEMTTEEKALYEQYNNAMTVTRNLAMTNYAEKALKSGKEVFICVGSAHVVGDGAMAQMLAERGYTVECITK